MAIDLSSMSASELEELIAQAGQRRAELLPEVAQEHPTGEMAVFLGPAWYVEPAEQGTILQIRHPGFGWLAFGIPAEHRAMLLSFLLQQALLAKPNENPGGTTAAAATATSGGSGPKLH